MIKLIERMFEKTFCNIRQYFSILHNYFDKLTKLFSDLHPAKFLDTSAKPFFPCMDKLIAIREHTQTKIKK